MIVRMPQTARNQSSLFSMEYSEVTMGILARSKVAGAKGGAGEGGYVVEFVRTVWQPLLKEIVKRKIKIVTNAGGMNPEGCRAAMERIAKEAGVEVPPIAVVLGDDLTSRFQELRSTGKLRPFVLEGEEEEIAGEDKWVASLNAYLGAQPIAAALSRGAQIVITGRCVDSALALGPLIHEFGWPADAYDLLSAGSLVGHILECGCQATGGNFTDWEESHAGGWENVGFPIAECFADGRFILTKPPNTGGIVTRATVAEQMLYEIGDPGAYILPDVICDWRYVKITDLPATEGKSGPSNRVLVEGARGRPPTPYYKTSGTYFDGFTMNAVLLVGGRDAAQKAVAVGSAILRRVSAILKRRGMSDFVGTNIEVLGAEHTYGPNARVRDLTREVVLRISATHTDPKALELLGRELAPAATSMAPGIYGGAGSGRPHPMPLVRHFSCLISRENVPITVLLDGKSVPLPPVATAPLSSTPPLTGPLPTDEIDPKKPRVTVPLIALCYGRSGDKGDAANIGLMCRKPEYYPLLRRVLTADAVKQYLSHLVKGRVVRYELPGIYGFNFVLTRALGGGGLGSLNVDRQGKAYAQQLLDFRVEIPADWLPGIRPHHAKL